ncbi:MAG TPA: sensor histidine kinase [Acidimicrobiales bacterium]|nr:sensor histidine kinase [Acidimicrobiales bacterium]
MIVLIDSPGARGGAPPLALALNLALLGLLSWTVSNETSLGLQGAHLAALCLLLAAALGWMGWVAARLLAVQPGQAAALLAMGLCGGALVGFAPIALAFPAVAALGATVAFRAQVAALLAVPGLVAMVSVVATRGRSFDAVYGGLAAACGGTVMGISRRQTDERARQELLLSVEQERAEIARARAELLAERNHLARELHDVLAHTLSALSLQLEALETVVDSEPSASPRLKEQLATARKLVHRGLDEARGAVRALREDSAPLVDQLSRLCEASGITLSVEGTSHQLSPEVSLSLYRTAQEGITNAMKHAPGAPVTVHLQYSSHGVHLDVENGPAHLPSPATKAAQAGGSGYGLQGIAERLALVGGHFDAGPVGQGWRVSAEVPA